MRNWRCVLELNPRREIIGGSSADLVAAIRAGADLRIGTEFLHNQHIDVTSSSAERIREVAEFGVTYLLEDRWAGGIMSLRQPISLPDAFGPRPSMSFFMYNIGTHPCVRVHPAIPLRYFSGGWDFGWLMVRTDGRVVYRRCDPYTLQFSDHATQHKVRWFVR